LDPGFLQHLALSPRAVIGPGALRRVPGEFAAHDGRQIVYLATGIRIFDDPRGCKAQQAVEQLEAELIRYWVDKRAGRDPDAKAQSALCSDCRIDPGSLFWYEAQ
jgi:hypothetical protein